MDLAVRRLGAAAHHQGVVRPARIVALLEHPGHDRGPAGSGHPRGLGRERPVERFGVRAHVGARVAEVAGERLREDDEVVAAGRQPVESRPVVRRFESGRRLDQREAQRGVAHPTSVHRPPAVPGPRGVCETPDVIEPGLTSFAAIVVAGGQATRLGGADKATIEIRGRTLLEHTLDAVIDAAEVVVVGQQVPTDRPVTFVIEDPQYGGPVAGLLTGRDSLLRTFPWLAVLAVDMPFVSSATIRRLHEAAVGHDGAVLASPEGRRQLAFVVDTARLDQVRPDREGQHGHPLWPMLEPLDMVVVPALAQEHRDVDTWTDLRDLGDDEPAIRNSDQIGSCHRALAK